MLICQICNKECKNFSSLSQHISRIHKLAIKYYYDKYLKKGNEGKCLNCGKDTKFIDINIGYRKFCNLKCSNNCEEIKNKKKQTCLEHHGVENPTQAKEIQEKVKKTKLKKYGNENYNNREKATETCLEKYGVKHNSQTKKNKEKVKKTWSNKTDEEINDIQNKKIQTWLKHYGVDHYFKSNEFKEYIEEYMLEHYGVEHYNSSNDFKDKIQKIWNNRTNKEIEEITKNREKTCLEKYGVKHNSQFEEIKEKKKQTMIDRYDVSNPCYMTDRTYSKISQELFWSIYDQLPQNLKEKCYFAELNKEFGTKINFKGYFYDFVISNIKFCIEFNGDYWHRNPKLFDVTNENIDRWKKDSKILNN